MKRLLSLFGTVIILTVFLGGCNSSSTVAPNDEPTLTEKYDAAVIDAMIAEDSEISYSLTAVKPENPVIVYKENSDTPYVLVSVFTKYPGSYPVNDTIMTWWNVTWATVVPELQNLFAQYNINKDGIILRLEQLLGLPPNSGNTSIIELWVKPEDLIRPAYDSRIDVNTSDNTFHDPLDQTYVTWFNNNIVYSYYPLPTYSAYPWTRLGYTYDWGNPTSEFGISEFLIKKNARVIVRSSEPAEDYLSK